MSSEHISTVVWREWFEANTWVFTTLDVKINRRGWNNSVKDEGVLSCEPVFEMSSTFSLSGPAQPIEKRTAARFQCIHEIYLLYKKISYSCTTVHLHNAFIQLSFLQDRERKKKEKMNLYKTNWQNAVSVIRGLTTTTHDVFVVDEHVNNARFKK